MDTKKVEESETYNINSMLYAIGGAVSLFLGISISMLFEVLELFIDLVISLINRR